MLTPIAMVAERLKKVRFELGYGEKQREFAELLDMKQGSYSDVERGKTKSISKKLLRNLFNEFGVNEGYLLYGQLPILKENSQNRVVEKEDSAAKFTSSVEQLFNIISIKDRQINDLIIQQGKLLEQQGKLIDTINSFAHSSKKQL